MNPNEWTALAGFLLEHDDYAIVCHENPDGDALGSLFALMLGLQQLKKRVQAICVDKVPHKYRRIAGAEALLNPAEIKAFTHLICVDCADMARTGLSESMLSSAKTIVNIDHHASNVGYGQWNLISHEAAATGILIYELLCALDVSITEPIAGNLFVAISSDTGHFMHANTNADCLRVASELVSFGAHANRVAQDMYQTTTLGWVMLLGRAIESMELYCEGKAALMCLSSQDFKDCGATTADVEGLIDTARNIETVQIAALIRETNEGHVKVSMRSKESVDVGKIASAFMGGGHKRAAGFSLEQPLVEAKAVLRSVLEGLQC